MLDNEIHSLRLITDGRSFKKASVIRHIVRYRGVRYKGHPFFISLVINQKLVKSLSKIGQKWSKEVKNGHKWAKMAKVGPKLVKNWSKVGQKLEIFSNFFDRPLQGTNTIPEKTSVIRHIVRYKGVRYKAQGVYIFSGQVQAVYPMWRKLDQK